ncbi:acetyl-CoA synthetase-like protein [Xylaria longipes]|nr:acetyl-CoA synthetase-like protein [Xylaria longipes]
MDQGKLAYVDGGDLPNTRQSIFAHIEDGLRKNPHAPAVICMHQKTDYAAGMVDFDTISFSSSSIDEPPSSSSSCCLTLTYAQLHQTALKLGAGLVARGVRPGSTLMCLIPNTIEYPLLVWACALLRLTLAAVDLSVLEDEGQLSAYQGIVRPDILVLGSADGARAADLAIAKKPALWECLRVQTHDAADAVFPGWTSFRNLVEKGASSPLLLLRLEEEAIAVARLDCNQERAKEEADRICSILFTSGTSAGSPKGCPLRVGSMTHILESQAWLINSDNCARVLQQAHNARAIAFYHTLQTWRAGGCLLVTPGPSFLVKHAVDAILRFGATFVVLSPAMVHGIAAEMIAQQDVEGRTMAEEKQKNSVRDIQVGGDAVTKEVLVKCTGLFPRARVLINHGMSEGGGFFAWPFFGSPVADIPFLCDTICPVGVVAPGARVRIRDNNSALSSSSSEVTCIGQPGELHICSDSLIRNYLGAAAGKKSSFYRDDKGALWMDTGDVGMMTDSGLVYILGRGKDAIKCGGRTIMPAALESCIEHFTGIQTCVVAVPSPTLGYEPFATLRNLDGFTESQIRDHVRETLGAAYSLAGVATLAQLGLAAYPVSATHKILKLEVQKSVMRLVQEL